ncbi:glycoside hydrolase family 19 protein [Kaistia sp. 32K]|uniref:glycoside hydrolase family 19 protein n=1 Tax=Kaistia sp. 32K TaxID=2795690 RepID=UPI001FD24612|nr:glycoside hydrolase family 19 protein [Kaistia sp. 32K]
MTTLLDEWEAQHAAKDDRWLAYALATTHHETDRSMQPIHERGSKEYFRQKYDITGDYPARARKNGNTTPGDGVKYCGRGYVQLTWKNNYIRAGDEIGHPELVDHPDDAMDPVYAKKILFLGMMGGWFTGKRLSDYFDGPKEEWVQARRIINGLDKANLIASYGQAYYAAISYTV